MAEKEKITVEISVEKGYNKANLECTIKLVSFEPTFTFMGFLYRRTAVRPSLPGMPGIRGLQGKAKVSVAVTHLALLGVKKQDAALWVMKQKRTKRNTKDKEQLLGSQWLLLFVMSARGVR